MIPSRFVRADRDVRLALEFEEQIVEREARQRILRRTLSAIHLEPPHLRDERPAVVQVRDAQPALLLRRRRAQRENRAGQHYGVGVDRDRCLLDRFGGECARLYGLGIGGEWFGLHANMRSVARGRSPAIRIRREDLPGGFLIEPRHQRLVLAFFRDRDACDASGVDIGTSILCGAHLLLTPVVAISTSRHQPRGSRGPNTGGG
jgi:hypothetical protein